MSKEMKAGKAEGKACFEAILKRYESQPGRAYSEIQVKLKELAANPGTDDEYIGFAEGFRQAYKNWRGRGNNAVLFDEWTTSNPEFHQKLQLSRLEAAMEGATPMSRSEIQDAFKDIQGGDLIAIHYRADAYPALVEYLILLERNDVISFLSGALIAYAIVESDDWGGDHNKTFKLMAGPNFDPVWFAQRTEREVDWVVVSKPSEALAS